MYYNCIPFVQKLNSYIKDVNHYNVVIKNTLVRIDGKLDIGGEKTTEIEDSKLNTEKKKS